MCTIFIKKKSQVRGLFCSCQPEPDGLPQATVTVTNGRDRTKAPGRHSNAYFLSCHHDDARPREAQISPSPTPVPVNEMLEPFDDNTITAPYTKKERKRCLPPFPPSFSLHIVITRHVVFSICSQSLCRCRPISVLQAACLKHWQRGIPGVPQNQYNSSLYL